MWKGCLGDAGDALLEGIFKFRKPVYKNKVMYVYQEDIYIIRIFVYI